MASVLLHAGLLSALMGAAEPERPTGGNPMAASEPLLPLQKASDRPTTVQVRALADTAGAGRQAGGVRGQDSPAGDSDAAKAAAMPDATTLRSSDTPNPPSAAQQGRAVPQGRLTAPPASPSTTSPAEPATGTPAGAGSVTALTSATAGSHALNAAPGLAAPAPAAAASRTLATGTTAQAANPLPPPPTANSLAGRAERAAPGTPSTGSSDDEHPPPPVYATRTPPAFRLSYALRRGGLSGQAELTLQRPGNGYELELKGTVLGLEVLGLSSRGGFGPQGFMPERFVDRRRGKDRLAANFDHAAGRITYSGTPAAQALLPGAQDRLSWMVQLAAVIEADPARYPAGSRIAMSVSGARGDVDTWTFIMQGRQRLSLPSGTGVETLRLTREPRRPYDTQVEVWLDPVQHHLPVRARLTVLPGGDTLELTQQPS